MVNSRQTPQARSIWIDERHGPLPIFLLILTFVTGLVDAVSYLRLGHVFVANMTGNVVFLGFAVAGAEDFSIPGSLTAIAGFMLGALVAGRLYVNAATHRGRLLARATYLKIILLGVALAISLVPAAMAPFMYEYGLLLSLAMAMGLQNAAARRLGVPDLTTTVLTMTLTGLAADSKLAGGKGSGPGRRLAAVITMIFGAGVGAVLVLHAGVAAALALAFTLQVMNGIAAYRVAGSNAPWTTNAP
jgi:uncharacterized membrane protein YoaK (UPF0700 family)